MSRRPAAQVARSRELRQAMTPEERRVWWHLRQLNRMGAHFRRQAAIGPYFADFADLRRGIVVEIDGGQHGGNRDELRDAFMVRHGYRVLRFWNSDVRENVDGVIEVIAAEVRRVDGGRVAGVESAMEGAPPPLPSPGGGGWPLS